ncbi:MAG: YfhO family protein [Oscillospiraceae bacterium]|nr:YfhO family protein [Oscillospiraceae bacterium]
MPEKCIDTKAKPFTIYIFALAFLGIMILSTQLSVIVCSEGYGIIAGIALMLSAIPLHIAAKKFRFLYLLSFLANAAGSGFSVSAVYLVKEIPVSLPGMMLSAIPAAAVLSFIYIMLRVFSKTKKFVLITAAAVNIALAVIAAVCWSEIDAVFFSFGFFALLVSLFFLCVFGIAINHDERPVLRDISFGSFGSFIIVTVVVIIILSEGDFFDFDLGFDGRKKTKNKQ